MIIVIDHGAGNLRSVVNAFEAIGYKPYVTSNPTDLEDASAIVLPGVGAFGDGMKNLCKAGMVDALNKEVIINGKPFLGICLGMQLLADVSLEHGTHRGLGWISGKVIQLEPNNSKFRVPHIGWNDLQIKRDCPLFNDLENPVFYFVHSYHLVPNDEDVVTATCWHGQIVVAAVQKDNIFGVQFHPEKSQKNGLKLLQNFTKLIRDD